MLTERRLVQCPHITVTTVDKLLHGTLTYNIRQKRKEKHKIIKVELNINLVKLYEAEVHYK